MAYSNKLVFDIARTLDTSTLSGSYVALGSALVHPAAIIKIVNNSNKLLQVSTDGSNLYDIYPANSYAVYDGIANTPQTISAAKFPAGTQFYVKGSSGTGLIYLIVVYLVEN